MRSKPSFGLYCSQSGCISPSNYVGSGNNAVLSGLLTFPYREGFAKKPLFEKVAPGNREALVSILIVRGRFIKVSLLKDLQRHYFSMKLLKFDWKNNVKSMKKLQI